MHTSLVSMGSDTANLLHSSALLASACVEAGHAIQSLLLQPVWRAEHLRVLRVREKTEVSAAAIVGKFNLPRDGNDDFESLASEFTQATPSDILDFQTTKDTFRHNIFWRFFSEVHEMSKFTTNQISQNQYIRSSRTAMQHLIESTLPYTDDEGSLRIDLSSVPFHLRRINVKGILPCDGCIIKTDMCGRQCPLPVAAFSILRPKDNAADVEAQEASQLVCQAALAYEQDPALNTYRSFAVHVRGTRLQVVSADIPRLYMEKLFCAQSCEDGFEVLHSPAYDLLEVEGRREALRVVFGLLKSLRSKSVRKAF